MADEAKSSSSSFREECEGCVAELEKLAGTWVKIEAMFREMLPLKFRTVASERELTEQLRTFRRGLAIITADFHPEDVVGQVETFHRRALNRAVTK